MVSHESPANMTAEWLVLFFLADFPYQRRGIGVEERGLEYVPSSSLKEVIILET